MVLVAVVFVAEVLVAVAVYRWWCWAENTEGVSLWEVVVISLPCRWSGISSEVGMMTVRGRISRQ